MDAFKTEDEIFRRNLFDFEYLITGVIVNLLTCKVQWKQEFVSDL